jgi:translation initiation factor 6
MPFKFAKARFNGDPNIGLYSFANDNFCLLGLDPGKAVKSKVELTLGEKTKFTTIAGTELIGLFIAGNNKGIVVPKIIEDSELENLRKMLDVEVAVISAKDTALGNLILCNDKGCMIPEKLKRYGKEISDALGCEVVLGGFADVEVLGSAAVATNNGCLCHRDATDEEMKTIQDILKVKVDVGTSGYGSPFIRSGIIVNSRGIVFSELSSGPEVGRFEEVFS